MKLCLIILFISLATASAKTSYSQNTKFTLNFDQITVKQIFDKIESSSEFIFVYYDNIVDLNKLVAIRSNNESLEEILEKVFKSSVNTYKVFDRQVVITKMENSDTELSISSAPQPQKKDISGQVADSKGLFLPGVSVVVKGTTIGVITDNNGKFSISVPVETKTLLFSFVGMSSQEIVLGNKSIFNVKLSEQVFGLEEVVTIGYGTEKKVNLTGALSVVSGNKLNKSHISSLAEMLQGQLAGLSVTQSTGEPGNEQVNMILRGRGSFGGSLAPLLVVDGIPVNDISAINTSAIESVTALKDAASSAIYGSRAAGGVLLITTKQGATGKEVISFDSDISVHSPARMPSLITNSAEYMTMYNEAKTNRYGSNVPNLYSQAQIDSYKNAPKGDLTHPNTDWANTLFRPAKVQNINLGITGGNENSSHNITLGIINQPGTMTGFDYKKYTLQMNLTSKLNKKIQIGVSARAMYGERGGAGGSVSTGMDGNQRYSENIMNQAINQAPTYGPRLPNGNFVSRAFPTIETPSTNPFATIYNTPTTDRDLRLETSAFLKVSFTDWLAWETRGGFNIDNDLKHSFSALTSTYYWDGTQPPNAQGGSVGGNLGASDSNGRMINPVFFSTLNLHKQIGSHYISAMGGYQAEYTRNNFFSAQRQDFLQSVAQQIDAGVNNTNQFTTGNSSELALESFFGRANYNYKEKYLVEINARADGSSRFSPAKRWGIFPSGSLAWRPLKESFMPEINWMSDLKLRASYGVLGNQSGVGGSNYLYQNSLSTTAIPGSAWGALPLYAFNKTSITQGVASPALIDPTLTWETTYSTNAGIDISLFKNKLTISVDYYHKKIVNILVPDAKLPYYSGYGTQVSAQGSMQNKGLEWTINYKGNAGDVNYGITWLVDGNRNMVLTYPTPGPWGKQMYSPGIEYGAYYLNIFDGIRQQSEVVNYNGTTYTLPAGTMIIKDLHGPSSPLNHGMGVGGPNGIVNRDGDRAIIQGATPKFESSMNLTASWKGFDISCFFYGVYGVKQYIEGAGWDPFSGNTAAPSTMWRDRWTPENHSTKMPMLNFGSLGTGVWYIPGVQADDLGRNTFSLFDGSYLRLKNINVGYTFNFQKYGINALRVYFSGDNLLTFTSYPGDPERSTGPYTSGIAAREFDNTFLRYPQNKIYSVGVSLKF